ncbi:MAG: hypothetical protein EPN45_03765 [Rhizobiaceae bacterium]|nr:MAG: hypothetical protein EPN45_03765 [Rhizobiaceae bacterium]
MKAAQLDEAQALVAARNQKIALRDRLLAGDTLHLTVGDGSGLSEIVLSAAYAAEIRGTVLAALAKRITADDEELARLGVEP